MPRLLPRLLKWLERNPPSQPDYRGPLITQVRRRRRSLWRPTLPAEELRDSFSFQNRRQSLILDHDNIFTSRRETSRHKHLPPVLRLQKNQEGRAVDNDTPKEMTEQEKQWWSSPYLRMLSSPFRRCMLSGRHLPTDFLIRLVVLKMPPTSNSSNLAALVPDGILHPKFASRAHGTGHYVTCWKQSLEMMIRKDSHRRIYRSVSVHSLLSEQISHQLRQRVLQEVEILSTKLEAAQRSSDGDVVLRRLSRSEWSAMKSTGQIPWSGVSCVIVVPPVNKDPQTKQKVLPNYSDIPPEAPVVGLDHIGRTLPPLPEISMLHPTEVSRYDEPLDFLRDTHLPHSCVPLYNGLSLFPSRPQRAALHEKLCEVLGVERQKQQKRQRQTRDQSSHAFILFSSGKTVNRVDTVPLAVAFWRIRIWEGAGWGDCEWLSRTTS